MRISSSSTTESTALRIHASRLDAVIANELRTSLGEAVSAAPGPILVDLSEVMFMDSSGLGALIGALKIADLTRLTIAGLTPAVRTVFRLTRIDRMFTIIEQPK